MGGSARRDRCGERVWQLADLVEQVVEDPPFLLASASDAELRGHGAEVIQDAADLDEAVVQLVDGFGTPIRRDSRCAGTSAP